MKANLIILWTQIKVARIRVKRTLVGVRITLTAFRFWLYVHSLRLVWNLVITPLYVRYENKVVNLIENQKVDARIFVTPMRLMFYNSPQVRIEDRYDYSHEDDYGL